MAVLRNRDYWWSECQSERKNKLLLFLICPFLSFLYSLRNIHTRSTYKVIFYFTIFFGLCMVFNKDVRNDGKFHAYEFQKYEQKDFSQYEREVKSFFSKENEEEIKDIFNISIMYVVSRVTDNFHIYFFVIAIFYALLFMRVLKLFTTEEKFDKSWASYILLYIFFIFQFNCINGVRFGLAAWIGIYCIFKIFRDKDKHYFLFALLTPLIHASFVIYIGILGLAYFSRKFENVWFGLFILSFIFSEVSMQLLSSHIDIFPNFIAQWVNSYVHYEEWYQTEGSVFYWLSKLLQTTRRYYYVAMVFLLYKNSSLIKDNVKTKDLYLVTLVFFTIANFLSSIPSFNRFVSFCIPMIAYIWLVNFKGYKYDKFLIVYLFISIVHFKESFDVYKSLFDPCFFYSSPFYLIWKYAINYTPITVDLLDN